MGRLLKIWSILLVGTLIGVLVKQGNGYAVITFSHYSIEMTLTLFIILNTLLFTLCYFLIRLYSYVYQTPKSIYDWYHNKYQTHKSQKNLTRGLLDLAEGRWKKAEKKLLRSVSDNENSLINYLGAAKAAQYQGDTVRRDSYIRLAHAQMPLENIAVGLTQVELQLADHQLEQALATLQHLHKIAPKHTYILRLLYDLYKQLSDWEKLVELLSELKKYKVFNPSKLKEIEFEVRSRLLKKIAHTNNTDKLIDTWKKQPEFLQKKPEFFSHYVHCLKYQHCDDKAEELLYKKFYENWQPELLEIYGKLKISEPGRHLKQLEKYLTQYPEDTRLLFLLGRLSLQARLWGKARDYLEKCVEQKDAIIEAYCELGRLLEYMGELKDAVVCYRKILFSDDKEMILLPPEVKSVSTLENSVYQSEPYSFIKNNRNV